MQPLGLTRWFSTKNLKPRMSLNQIVFLNLGLVVASMSTAAYFWHKKKFLRWLPVPATLMGAIIYLLFGPVAVTPFFVVKIMATFLVVGFLFYFVLWIECREPRKKPNDR